MRILFVNHTFPPESYAGSELCVYSLALEFLRRGHETAVFYRYNEPADDEYQVKTGCFETVPVYKINNTFRFSHTFRDIYLNSAVTAKFAHVLGEFKPDVVHFHHLTNLSLSLVQEAKSRGCKTVMTLHDYWLLCQRGQLLKRDLRLCRGPSVEACRSCLASQLLRGNAQRLVSRLWKTGRIPNPHDAAVRSLMDLSRAKIRTPRRDYVGSTTFGLGDRPGETLLAHPPTEISYFLDLKYPAQLETSIALHPSTYEHEGGGVRFEIVRNETLLYSRTLNPKHNSTHRGWHPVSLPLAPSVKGRDRLILKTVSEHPENNQYCTAGWRNPVLVYSDPSASFQPISERRREIYHLLFKAAEIVADSVASFSSRAAEGLRHRSEWVRRVWEDVDLFISPSQFLRDFFSDHGFPKDKILYLDNGFPTPPPVSPTPREGPLRFGYIGTWIPSKGVDMALEAFREIDPYKARLIVHGFFPGYDGYEDYETRLCALAGPAVEFRGKYEPFSVYALLSEIDCLVMPSIWWENSPLTLHEAFQAKVPVITADVGGMAELVQHGGGLTFHHRDAESLRRTIERILREPKILDDLRSTIPDVKSISHHADELLDLYARMLRLPKH